MKNSSRLIALLIVGSLGATPLYAMEQEPKFKYTKTELAKIISSLVFIMPVGLVLKYKTDVKKIRSQFPDYSEHALKFAGLCRLFGFRRVIHNVVVANLAKLRNPKKVLRALAQDDQLVNATAFATNFSREKVRKVLNNPGMVRSILTSL